jgi:hypothetical protein
MVRAAIAAFGVPFILGMGALAVYRNTKDLFLTVEGDKKEASAPAEPAPAPKANVEEPAAARAGDLEELARRRAEQAKQDQLHGLEPEAIVREWLSALAEKQKDAANADNQQALAAAASQFSSVFLTKCPQEAAVCDIRAELDYDLLDKCLASLASLADSSLRKDLDGYIRSKVVKLAETFQMHPVDRERLAQLAASAAEGASIPDGK